MTETRKKMEKFVDEAIKRNDFELLDILWIFSYSTSSKSGYHASKAEYQHWLGRICKENLRKKYNLKQTEIVEKIKTFADFLNTIPDFLSKEKFYEDKRLLREILFSKTSKILIQNTKSKMQHLSALEKKILSFVLNYIPIRVQDSVEEAERRRQEYPNSYEDKYGFLLDFSVITSGEYIDRFRINPEEWTDIFNRLFGKKLKERKLRIKSARRSWPIRYQMPGQQYKEYSFWQLGDELVKMGVGYWTFHMSGKANVSIDLIIPNSIYEAIKDYKDRLPVIENFAERINEIKKKKEIEILIDLTETEDIEEVSEYEIERSLVLNPGILEEGLKLIGNQYSTDVGRIDILCEDRNGNFVVVELKKGIGSDKVVGQIQRYMAWVAENLAEDKQVRGIIVAKESDKSLEYAIKGSSFPIEIKVFGQEPPIEENIKYCSACGSPNIKSAKYCTACGRKFYM